MEEKDVGREGTAGGGMAETNAGGNDNYDEEENIEVEDNEEEGLEEGVGVPEEDGGIVRAAVENKDKEEDDEEEECVKAILKSEEEMFRSDGNFLNWNVVQLLRSLLVVVLKTFVINPVYRLLIFIPVFGVFLLHDSRTMPFKNHSLNFLQISSTLSLLLITTCNLVNAFAYMNDISGIPDITVVMDVLGYVETIISIAFIPVSLIVLSYGNHRKKQNEKVNRTDYLYQ